MANRRGPEQASQYLRILLEQTGAYRVMWREQVQRESSDGGINFDAVARVLHAYEVRTGLSDNHDHRGLSDRVRRALNGQPSAATVDLFIAAFTMRSTDASTLRRLFRGESSSMVVGSALAPPELRQRNADPGYETRSLHETHILGPDGVPIEHHTSHVIQASGDGVSSYLYAFDTAAAVVEVEYGGTVGQELIRLGQDFFAVEIDLGRKLVVGDPPARIEYRTTFRYPSPPEPEFRRGALRNPARDLSMRVQFDPAKLPREIWWGEWQRLEDHERLTLREDVPLQGHSVERHLDYVERAIVGFRWSW